MAFGFIVEKFDLFFEFAAPSLAGHMLSIPGQKFGNIVGLALIVVGTAMVAIAAIRFLLTAKNIDSEDVRHGVRSIPALARAGRAGCVFRDKTKEEPPALVVSGNSKLATLCHHCRAFLL